MIIKEEFDLKLKELGVREQFIKNVNKQWDYPNQEVLDIILDEPTFEKLISRCFPWYATPEKHEFWEKISQS